MKTPSPITAALKKIALLLWAITLLISLYFLYTYMKASGLTLHDTLFHLIMSLQEKVHMTGRLAFLVYIILYALRPLLFFPASLMTLCAVTLFGPYKGFALAYAGETLSSSVAYITARYFASSFFEKQKYIQKIEQYVHKNSFTSVLMLRLVPLFPFDAVNYGLGALKVPFSSYFFATAIGVLPGLTAYIFLGNSLLNKSYIYTAIFFFTLLTLLSLYIKKKMMKHSHL